MFHNLFNQTNSASVKTRYVARRMANVLAMLVIFATLSASVHAQAVQVDTGFLDSQKVLGPKWVRVDFTPLTTGEHTVLVSSDASANIRFTVFEIDGVTGNRTTLAAAISGTATLAQWSGTLDLSNQYYLGIWAVSGSGNFTVELESDTVVVDPLVIASQPSDVTVTEGVGATFSVTASGDGTLTYQWYENNQPIAGATAASYSIAATTIGDNGNQYSVDVSDDNETLSSASATLTVDALAQPLVITAQPVDVTVTEGEGATFSVTASGDGTLTYQWFENNQPITGANAASYSIAATTIGDNGNQYSVDVSDDNETLSSASATLTVDALAQPLVITAQPVDVTVTEGEGATFSVTASGDGTLTYQWYENNQPIAGATAASYSIAATTIGDNGNQYSVDVSDDNETLSSAMATLTVEAAALPLVIASQPTDITVTEGQSATFSVTASGDGTLTYQWYENNQPITGATAASYSIAATTIGNNGNQYSVDISDANSTLSSSAATLTVNEIVLPVTTTNIGQGILDSDKALGPRWVRVDFNALSDSSHTITVSWDSTADVKYRVFNTDGTLLSPLVQGANPGVWTGDLNTASNYYLALWSSSGVANYTATIETYVPISIENQPIDRVVTENDDVTFYVDAAGSGNLSYQWFANGLPLTGETGDSLTIFAASLFEDGTLYNVEVSNSVETVASDFATLTVNEPLVLGLFSQEADTTAWMLDGPAPTLDFNAGADTDAWGRSLLRVGDLLLVGGDFTGIKPLRWATPTARPFLAAFDAVTGQPVTTFQVPSEVDAVVRSLTLSPDGNHVYIGGDFGFMAVDATTGTVIWSVNVTNGANPGRVFDVAVSDTQIYIGGQFQQINNVFRANIARLSLNGQLDTSWSPQVTSGFNNGRSAPVQSIAVSTDNDTVYIGGNFKFIDGTPIWYTPQNGRISLLPVSALDGSVKPERFFPDVEGNSKGLTPHDILVTDFYVIVAWGGPNYLSFHALDGTRLKQYRGKGDIQSLQVVGDHVFVGHHGEFFQTVANPIPQEAVVSLSPRVIVPYKFHSFRIDDPSFLPEQAWTLNGAFGVWGIAAAADSIWIAGQITSAGTNGRWVEGLVKFPALP
jgi:hypothetical protein